MVAPFVLRLNSFFLFFPPSFSSPSGSEFCFFSLRVFYGPWNDVLAPLASVPHLGLFDLSSLSSPDVPLGRGYSPLYRGCGFPRILSFPLSLYRAPPVFFPAVGSRSMFWNRRFASFSSSSSSLPPAATPHCLIRTVPVVFFVCFLYPDSLPAYSFPLD